jgi:hypothetical protein
MASAIIDGTNIDLSVFSYSAAKVNPTGGKVVNLLHKDFKESLTIAVPMMGSWGAQEVKTLDGGSGKYTMTLQFSKGEYTTPEADKFLEQMKAVERKIKEDAITRSKEWFSREITNMEVMDEKFTPMLKYPKKNKTSEERDYTQPPQLTVKLPCWKDVWQTSVFDESGNPLYVKGKTTDGLTPLNFLTSQSKAPIQVICLIQCAGLWFVGNPAKVSITWNLKQVVIKKPKTSSIADDTCFLTVRPNEMELLTSQPDTEVAVPIDHSVSAFVESDDEEEYSLPPPQSKEPPAPLPTQEPVAEPVAEVKKKVIAKKTKKET